LWVKTTCRVLLSSDLDVRFDPIALLGGTTSKSMPKEWLALDSANFQIEATLTM